MMREKKKEKREKRQHLLLGWSKRSWCFIFLLSSPFFLLSAVSAEITQAQIDDVGKELACLCGTCPRRPLDECTCGHAQQERDRIKSLLESGKNKQEVIDAFIADFGKQVLSKPPAEGFNLTAWVMPPLILVIGFFVVRTVLRTWSQAKPASGSAPSQPEAQDPYLARLEEELKERES